MGTIKNQSTKYLKKLEDSDMGTNYREAMFFHTLEDGRIQCDLCPHHCKLKEGQCGICRVREVKNDKLYLKYYGMIGTGGQSDPIEKKPLYHFRPGTRALSFGGMSCNFNCDNCQNSTLSQDYDEDMMVEISPEEIIKMARNCRCQGIAWTYNEPTIYFETYYDWSKIFKQQGLYIVWVSNSYIAAEPLKKLAEVVDGINFDVKAFREEFYQKYIHAHLQPVLDTCILAKKLNIHIELTYLIIPTLNDSMVEIKEYLQWVKDNLGIDTPLHFSRFYPQNRMTNFMPTPVSTVCQAVETAYNMGIKYAYAGNIHPNQYNSTLCPNCKKEVIERRDFSVTKIAIKNGKCQFCQSPVLLIQ